MGRWILAGSALPLTTYIASTNDLRERGTSRHDATGSLNAEQLKLWEPLKRPTSATVGSAFANRNGRFRAIPPGSPLRRPASATTLASRHQAYESQIKSENTLVHHKGTVPTKHQSECDRCLDSAPHAAQSRHPDFAQNHDENGRNIKEPLKRATVAAGNVSATGCDLTVEKCHSHEQVTACKASHKLSKQPQQAPENKPPLSNIPCLGSSVEVAMPPMAASRRPVSATTLRPRGDASASQLMTGPAVVVHKNFEVVRRQCINDSMRPKTFDSQAPVLARSRVTRPHSAPAGPGRNSTSRLNCRF